MEGSKRMKLVEKCNDPEGEEFVFLLRGKGEGCGINFMSANQLSLLNLEKNPSTDQQALVRVGPEGQKKDYFAHGPFTTGIT